MNAACQQLSLAGDVSYYAEAGASGAWARSCLSCCVLVMNGTRLATTKRWMAQRGLRIRFSTNAVTASCCVTCLTSAFAPPVHHVAGTKRRRTMKQLKQVPLWLTIDALIIIVGLGLIALGIVVASSRILGVPV